MGKDLHPSILSFFRERTAGHDNVVEIEQIEDEEEYLFRIRRRRPADTIVMWLSDAYLFTDADYYDRPATLGPGDYILVGKPEGGFHVDRELIDRDRIGVGQIGKFMGALNTRNMWTFLTREEKEKLGRAGRR